MRALDLLCVGGRFIGYVLRSKLAKFVWVSLTVELVMRNTPCIWAMLTRVFGESEEDM